MLKLGNRQYGYILHELKLEDLCQELIPEYAMHPRQIEQLQFPLFDNIMDYQHQVNLKEYSINRDESLNVQTQNPTRPNRH